MKDEGVGHGWGAALLNRAWDRAQRLNMETALMPEFILHRSSFLPEGNHGNQHTA